jgi:molecular chaperone DnaJ
MMAKTYYVILGVASDATQQQIEAAYRQKALELHPDHYGQDAGPFLSVQEAYAVLGDPARRRDYDRSLHEEQVRVSRAETWPVHVGRRHRPVQPHIPVQPVDIGDVSLGRSFQTFSPSFDAILHRLFSNFAGGYRPKAEAPRSLTVDVPIMAEDALAGGNARILVPAVIRCPTCHGYGGVGPFECWRCSAEGYVTEDVPLQIAFPPGLTGDHIVTVSLDRLGITNTYLVVRFRVV